MNPGDQLTTRESVELRSVLQEVFDEAARASVKFGTDYHSAHEAYAVLLEEVDEFKAWVWEKRDARDRREMIKELVQVAAVAVKYATQLDRQLAKEGIERQRHFTAYRLEQDESPKEGA